MSVITQVPEPNIWDEICKDFQSRRPPYKDDDAESVVTNKEDYDPARMNPVFYGKMYHQVENIDTNPAAEFDPATGHPSCVGYSFVDRPPVSPPPKPPTPPPKKSCSPREYLETYIFPVLLPAMEEMLRQAKKERCFERKRTKFNALDFLTEYLYKRNPEQKDRDNMVLWDIPFVKEWLKDHPRPPLPKSLLWSEEEAALIIQSFWRGYKIRCEPEIQELRQWQKEWREENENINNKVEDFWAKQMPEGDSGDSQQEGESQQAQTQSEQTSDQQANQQANQQASDQQASGQQVSGEESNTQGETGESESATMLESQRTETTIKTDSNTNSGTLES